ncbi:hypothetical protein JTB14_013608 [Gonioctena quinquepunctata]|nr:hypothetical protein JTB14_013608 [Gonioctena quinquepunctata]
MKELLETISIELEIPGNSPENYWSDGNPEEYDGTPLNSDQEDRKEEASPWVAPVLTDEDVDFDFTPKTKEQEPPIPAPKANIEAQGIDCLRLGKTSFNKIRYMDVQKKLQALPVVSALLVNPLARLASENPIQEQLLRIDTVFGTVSYCKESR